MEKLGSEGVNRNDIQKELGVTVNTVKKRINTLFNLGFVTFAGKEGNCIYYISLYLIL